MFLCCALNLVPDFAYPHVVFGLLEIYKIFLEYMRGEICYTLCGAFMLQEFV